MPRKEDSNDLFFPTSKKPVKGRYVNQHFNDKMVEDAKRESGSSKRSLLYWSVRPNRNVSIPRAAYKNAWLEAEAKRSAPFETIDSLRKRYQHAIQTRLLSLAVH